MSPAGFGGNANNYQAPEARALSSIAKSPGPNVNSDFVKMISQHDSQIKFLADQLKQAQKGVAEANQNPIQQIQQFIADLTVLLGGGELPKGALEFGDLQYILPAIGALFGFGSGGFPVNLFAAAEKFFLGYVVPSQQYNDLTIAAINSWGEQLGIDPQFLGDLSALVRAFGDLFSAIQDLLNACGGFISMLFTPDGEDLGPLGQILQPIVSFLGFGWLDLSKFGDGISWITDGLDPGIRKLVATINNITTMIASLTAAINNVETDVVGYFHDQGGALDNAVAQILQWIGNALGIPGSNAPEVAGVEHAPAISSDVAAWTIDEDADNGWMFDASVAYNGSGGSFVTHGTGVTKRLLTQDRLPCFSGQRLTVDDYFQWSGIPNDADAGACVVFYTGSTEIGQTDIPLPNQSDSADWTQVRESVTVPADADEFRIGVFVSDAVTSGTVRVGQISTRNWTWIAQHQVTSFIEYFQNLGHVFDGVDWTSSNVLNQMWQGIVNTWIQPIAGWLTPDSPINAANLVGNLFPDGLPLSWLTSTPRNELDNADFRTAISLVGGTTWRWTDGIYFADSTSTGSACTTADGTDRALRSNPIDVVAGKSVSMSVEVLADDLTGTGNPVQLWAVPDVGDPVLIEAAFPSGGDSGWHGAPIGSKSVTLNGSYTPTAGVSTVQMRFAVTADATSGDVYFDHAKAWIVGGWLEQIWDQTTDIFAAFSNADTQEEFAAAWNLVLDLFELPHPENFWTWLVNSFIAPLFGLDSQTAAEIGDDITELLDDTQAKNDAWQTFLQACWDALTSSDTFSQKIAAIQTAWNAFAEVVGDIQADETLTLQNILNQLFHLDATGKIDISWLAGLLPQNQVDGLQTDLNQITSAQTTANTAFQNLLNGFAEALTGADLNGDADVETWTSAWDEFTGVLAGTQQAQNNAWQDIWNRLWGLNSDGTVKTTSIPFFDDVRKLINQMVAPLHWGYFNSSWAWVPELNTPSTQLPGSNPVLTPGSNDGSGDAISSHYDDTIPPPPTGLVAVPIPFTVANFPAGKITYAIAAVKNGIEGPATKVSVRMDTLFPPNCTGQVNLAWDAMSGYTFKIYRQVDATYQATDWHLVGSPSTAGTWLTPYQDTTVRTGGTVAHPKTDAELSAQIVTTVKTTAAIAKTLSGDLSKRAFTATFTKATLGFTGLSAPRDIAVDSDGNVYVANTLANTVLKLTPDGMQSFAGFVGVAQPSGIAVDSTDNLYTVSHSTNVAYKLTPDGVQTTLSALTELNTPWDITVDSTGVLYVTNGGNSTVDKLAGGTQTRLPFTGLSGQITGVAIDSVDNVYVADWSSNKVFKLTPDGTQTTVPLAGLSNPFGVAVDSVDNLYVTNNASGTVVMLTPDGVQTTIAADLTAPAGIAVDSVGNVYVVDNTENAAVILAREITSNSQVAASAVASPVVGDPNIGHTVFATKSTADDADIATGAIVDGIHQAINYDSATGTAKTAAAVKANLTAIPPKNITAHDYGALSFDGYSISVPANTSVFISLSKITSAQVAGESIGASTTQGLWLAEPGLYDFEIATTFTANAGLSFNGALTPTLVYGDTAPPSSGTWSNTHTIPIGTSATIVDQSVTYCICGKHLYVRTDPGNRYFMPGVLFTNSNSTTATVNLSAIVMAVIKISN